MIQHRTVAVATRLDPVAPVQQEPARFLARKELALLDQWVVCKLVKRRAADGTVKYDKPPMRVVWVKDKKYGGMREKLELASHSDPTQWMPWVNAMSAKKNATDGCQGYGFVFHDSDPYTGIDLDGCRDPQTGAIEPWAQRWIDALNSYTEISQSDTGVKIWVRGKLPKALFHSLGPHKGIEVYSRERYFWMTHNRLAGTPETINDAQPILDAMVAEFNPPKPPAEPKPIRKVSPGEAAADLASIREKFNSDHDMDELLTSYGAVETRYGYECPCGVNHTHHNTLFISREGRLFSRSPQCNWHTRHGWDAFGLYVKVEHNDNIVSALKALNPIQPKRRDPGPGQPDYLLPAEVERRKHDAARHRQERQETKERRLTWQAIQTSRLADDEAVYDAARKAWAIHCKYYGTVAQHNVSVARMAADLCGVETAEEVHVRKMQRANDWLIDHGYLVRTERTARRDDGKQHTNIWQPAPPDAVRVSRSVVAQQDAENAVRDTLVDHEITLIDLSLGTCERAPSATASDLDTWAWCEDGHGADELDFLSTENPVLDRVLEEVHFPQTDEPAPPLLLPAEPPLSSSPYLSPVSASAPTIVSTGASDARGMSLVRWSDGSATWRRGTDPDRHLSKMPEIANPPNAFSQNGNTPKSAKCAEMHNCDAPGATYDPALDWTEGTRITLAPAAEYEKPADLRAIGSLSGTWRRLDDDTAQAVYDELPNSPRLVLAPPTDPALLSRYYGLRGAARKSTNDKQRYALNRQADALMVYRPLSELTTPVVVQGADTAPPLTSSSAHVEQLAFT